MNAEQAYLHVMDLIFGTQRGPHVRNKAAMVRPVLLGLEKRGAIFEKAYQTQLWFRLNGQLPYYKLRFRHPTVQGPQGRQRGCFELIEMLNGKDDGPTRKTFYTQPEADAFQINPVF